MRAKIVAGTAGLAVLIAMAGPVGAITNGTPDNGAHPYVGVVVFYGSGGNAVARCSGELLSSTVFLTSGHCITLTGATSGEVWFDEHAVTTKGTGNTGSLATSPDGELGSVMFGTTASVGGVATLPAVGVVDALVNKTPLVIVGYGVTEQDKISGNPIGRWNNPTDRTRRRQRRWMLPRFRRPDPASRLDGRAGDQRLRQQRELHRRRVWHADRHGGPSRLDPGPASVRQQLLDERRRGSP